MSKHKGKRNYSTKIGYGARKYHITESNGVVRKNILIRFSILVNLFFVNSPSSQIVVSTAKQLWPIPAAKSHSLDHRLTSNNLLKAKRENGETTDGTEWTTNGCFIFCSTSYYLCECNVRLSDRSSLLTTKRLRYELF